jgi:tRNA(Ile)-lysidine synthase
LKKAQLENLTANVLNPTSELIFRIRSFSARHGMFGRGMKVVVGVSGGSDSVGLLEILRQFAPEYDLELHVVHLNHMLRPEAADDAAFVRQLALCLNLPVTIGCARVGAIARRLRIGIEEAGRLARYQLLEQVADRVGAQRIAMGHHAGDQVETVLFNLMRGTGPGGLAGIPPRRGRVVRPLLCASREEIAAYCRTAGLEWRTDASNLSPEYLRNRIRHRLLPILRAEFNPRIDQAVLRLAEIVGEENRWIGRHVESLLSPMLLPATINSLRQSGPAAPTPPAPSGRAEEVRLGLSTFVGLPLALQRRLLLAAVRRAGGSLRHLGYQNLSDCLDFLARGNPGGTVQFPGGVRVRKDATCFTVAAVVSDAGGRTAESGVLDGGSKRASVATGSQKGPEQRHQQKQSCSSDAGASVALTVPGKTLLPGLGLAIRAGVLGIAPGTWRLDAEGCSSLHGSNNLSYDIVNKAIMSESGQSWDPGDTSRVCFDDDQLAVPLTIRTRREGDRLRPFGMQGAKKLKKLLGELRIPRGERDKIPLVVSGGEIIWVVGCRRARVAPVTEQTRHILVLDVERL